MSLKPQPTGPVPDDTARVARAVFPKGNLCLTLPDEIGIPYNDSDFGELFSATGQPAACPWRLALVCILQFIEDLPDRQAADAVRARIDWKYALALPLEDPGFDASVLSEFRTRLLNHKLGESLLELLLNRLKEKGWLKERTKQRTDSTHVIAAIRTLNRLECVGETLRAALNALSVAAPNWLRPRVGEDWVERYSKPVEEYRLPKGIQARREYAETIGADGMLLLNAIWSDDTPIWLREMPAIEVLRHVWVHQYYFEDGQLRLRSAENLAPTGSRFDSPYDTDARYGNKRSTTWRGYKVHLSETCDGSAPHLITNVMTTRAHISDVEMTAQVHRALADKQLLPAEHLVDAGYVDAELLIESAKTYGVKLIGPVRPNSSWQARQGAGYDLAQFKVNWKSRKVTCPQGKKSKTWLPKQDSWGNSIIYVRFSRTDCRLCPTRELCTQAKTEPRSLAFRPEAGHKAIQQARHEQQTQRWKTQYNARAGIEGTISHGVRVLGLRHNRYSGMAKTHLQHLLTAAAMNILRMSAWLQDEPRAKTRTSHFAALLA
jgi:transposase